MNHAKYGAMNMAKGKTRHFMKTFIDIPRWVGVEEIVTVARSVKRLGRSLFVPKQPERIETFEQAVERLDLTEDAIKQRCRQYYIFAMIYAIAALLFMGYAIHVLFLKHYFTFITTIVLAVLLMTFAFREHFWYTQMKYRRLGFTFQEWFKSVFNY